MRASIRWKCFGIIAGLTVVIGAVCLISIFGSQETREAAAEFKAQSEFADAAAVLDGETRTYRRAVRLMMEGVPYPKDFDRESARRLIEQHVDELLLVASDDRKPEVSAAGEAFLQLDDLFIKAVMESKRLRADAERIGLNDCVQVSSELSAVGAAESMQAADPALRAIWREADLRLNTFANKFLLAQRREHDALRRELNTELDFVRQSVQRVHDGIGESVRPAALAPLMKNLESFERTIIDHMANLVKVEQLEQTDLFARGRALEDSIGALIAGSRRSMDELGNGLIARAEATTQTMVFALVVALFVAGIGMWILSRTVLRPLMASVMAMEDLGRGDADLSRRLPEAGDVELSRLAQAFNRFVESVGTEIRKVASLSQDLTGLVGQVKDLGQRLATSSDTTKQRVGAASTQAGDVDVSMQSISAAVEEMTASITEIANHSQNSQELSHRVATMANDAITQVRRLGTSSSEIGDVIRVITSIAEQTNLLALNATIESARAGDAGKGFAVVANEVKELAKSTAEATEDIGRKVEAIQADTRGAIAVIEKIASMVDQVTEAASTIAAAVQEQSATSSEISKSVHRAAQGASGILSEVREVQEAATVTERCRDDLLSASQAISQASSSLQGVTSRYRS